MSQALASSRGRTNLKLPAGAPCSAGSGSPRLAVAGSAAPGPAQQSLSPAASLSTRAISSPGELGFLATPGPPRPASPHTVRPARRSRSPDFEPGQCPGSRPRPLARSLPWGANFKLNVATAHGNRDSESAPGEGQGKLEGRLGQDHVYPRVLWNSGFKLTWASADELKGASELRPGSWLV